MCCVVLSLLERSAQCVSFPVVHGGPRLLLMTVFLGSSHENHDNDNDEDHDAHQRSISCPPLSQKPSEKERWMMLCRD